MNNSFNQTWPTTRVDRPDALQSLSTLHAKPDALKNTLPLLPGYTFNSKRPRDFRRGQTLQYTDGIRVANSPHKHPAELIPGRHKTTAHDIQLAHPTWTSLVGKVLRFFAYFKEGVHESRPETWRIRRCHIYYYLEDDTIQITEPKQENSGIPQGNLVKRHKVLKSPDSQEYYSVDDFDVGADISIYGKVFHIVDCDASTRYFYSQLGRSMQPFEDYPADSFATMTATRQWEKDPQKVKDAETREMLRYHECTAGGRLNLFNNAEKDAAVSFFENDRKVLQFKAFWDDRGKLHGDARYFTLYYFLADGNIKIVEACPRNSGRDPFPVFWQKQKLPMVRCPAADRNLETMTCRPQEFVSDSDLMIGKVINVCGREMLLFDCDDFTRHFYREKYGITDFEPIDVTIAKPEPKRSTPPPHFGPGSPEDSLTSWTHLVIRPPRKDMQRLLEKHNDQVTHGGYLEAQPERRLVVVFHPADDTVGIFEKPGDSNGFLGGKFLVRQRVKKPIEGNATLSKEAPYYTVDDFYVGARLNINSHIIVLDQVDEATVKYLEGTPKPFTVEDMDNVMKRIQTMMTTRYGRLTDFYRAMDSDHDGRLTLDELRTLCRRLNMRLSDHELMCLMLYIDENHNGSVEFYEFVRKMAPQDYEGELCPNRGRIPLVKLAELDDQKYHQVAYTQGVQREMARVFKMFREKLLAQRFVFLDLFRMVSDRSFDATIGEKEFIHTVQYTLQMNLTPKELDLLRKRFFPYPGRRLTQQEFTRVMDSAPHFETTTK